jgi:hypothetical protein
MGMVPASATKITKALSAALSPLVGGSAKEISGYLADNIRYLRWKNAIRILERAQEFCAKKKLSSKAIPIKFIVPFLEAASLEEETEDPTISDMWAALFANSVTSYQARHAVYIDILKKLSSNDAAYLKALHDKMIKDDVCGDDGFDPDIWNVLDKQDTISSFQQMLLERGKNILDDYKKNGFFSADEKAKQIIRACTDYSSVRADFIPLVYDIALFNTREWQNSSSSPFDTPAPHIEIVSNLCALNILEKFECVAWYPRPHKEGFWAIRVTASLAFATSIGFDFMKACTRPLTKARR